MTKSLPQNILSSKYCELWLLKRTNGDLERYVAQLSCILLDIPYKIRKTGIEDFMLVELIPNTVKLNMKALDSKNPNAIDHFDKRSIVVTYLTKMMLNNGDSNPANIIYNNRGQLMPIDFGNLYDTHCYKFLMYLNGSKDHSLILSEINKMIYEILTNDSALDLDNTKYIDITPKELREIIKSLITEEKINKMSDIVLNSIDKHPILNEDETMQTILSNIETIHALDEIADQAERNPNINYEKDKKEIMKNLFCMR